VDLINRLETMNQNLLTKIEKTSSRDSEKSSTSSSSTGFDSGINSTRSAVLLEQAVCIIDRLRQEIDDSKSDGDDYFSPMSHKTGRSDNSPTTVTVSGLHDEDGPYGMAPTPAIKTNTCFCFLKDNILCPF
jgi:hypothetical protein